LSAIVRRIRGRTGAIPLVPSYDTHEKTWNPPLPLLFQRAIFGERRPISDGALREILQRALAGAGTRGHDSQPLVFTPHDFRRIFVTEAVINGLPPHIAQVICGHRDISTTMGYKAIYPAEAIEAHRAFITRRRRRRQARPDRCGPTAASHHGPARHARIPRHRSAPRPGGSLTGKPDNKA